MGALDTAVREGKALYAGISSYSSEQTSKAAAILRGLGTRLLIHQPAYNMLNRWVEDDGLLDVLEAEGAGCIAFSPLAQGVLSGKYLDGIPQGSRATRSRYLSAEQITQDTLGKVRALGAVAKRRGQTLAQMAVAWTVRDPRMTSAIVGVSSVSQLEENLAALANAEFPKADLDEIDRALKPAAGTHAGRA